MNAPGKLTNHVLKFQEGKSRKKVFNIINQKPAFEIGAFHVYVPGDEDCGTAREIAMSYHATWLRGREVVADDEFEDLLEAQAFVLQHLKSYHDTFGANGVKVWDERAIYFQVEDPPLEA